MKKLTLLMTVLLVSSFVSMSSAAGPPVGPVYRVSVIGDFQSEIGCSPDWSLPCSRTNLFYSSKDGVWWSVFYLPPGNWRYKAALNNSVDITYGANAQYQGEAIPLPLPGRRHFKIYYDDVTHWVTDNVSNVIAVAMGSFQTELGCPFDRDPRCLRSWLKDPDGDGIYTLKVILPPGGYTVQTSHNESFTDYFGLNGAYRGAPIPFTVDQPDSETLFSYDLATHLLEVVVAGNSPRVPDGDGDGVADADDNCPADPNPGQEDGDGDGAGDVCDACPSDPENDADKDGLCADEDSCPDSLLSPTVVIEGCDSGAENALSGNGCSISDEVALCSDGAVNHGGFVSCVAAVVQRVRDAGTVTGREGGKIKSCAARSSLPLR